MLGKNESSPPKTSAKEKSRPQPTTKTKRQQKTVDKPKESGSNHKKRGAKAPPASIDLAMRLLSGKGLHEGRRGALVVLSREGVG